MNLGIELKDKTKIHQTRFTTNRISQTLPTSSSKRTEALNEIEEELHVIFHYTLYTSYAMLSSGDTVKYATRHLQVASSTVSHEKALHNYFIPCLKTSWKFWEELGNLREFPKTSENA